MMTAAEKANLARIRDNQRRSRARRKEYLQELEARLRQCELQGVEASSEIQVAARRVADENKKLRGLLLQSGVTDDIIEAYLQSSPTSDTVMEGQYGSSSGTVQMLEQLLATRKSCCADVNPTANTRPAGGTESRGSSISTVQSVLAWDSQINRRPSGPLQQSSQPHQSIAHSPSTTSRTSSVSLGQGSSRGIPHHQRLPPVQIPRNTSISSNPPSRNIDFFEYDPELAHSNVSYNDPQQHVPVPQQHVAQKHFHSPNSPQRLSSSYHSTPITNSNVNSCIFATDMITTMAGGDPSAVRADLGCMSSMDCEVDNQHVFNVMDRYSGVEL